MDNSGMELSFFKKSLLLKLDFGEEIPEKMSEKPVLKNRIITNWTFTSTKPEPLLAFCHRLVLDTFPEVSLRSQCPDVRSLPVVLHKLSVTVVEVSRLMSYLSWLKIKHQATFKDSTVNVRFSCSKARVFFEVTYHLEATSPLGNKPAVNVKTHIGKLKPDNVLELISAVSGGPDYIRETVTMLNSHIKTLQGS